MAESRGLTRREWNNGQKVGVWCGTGVEYHWRRIRKKAGIPDLHIHDLRRTTASWLACEGVNLPIIQSVLNHSSLAVTQIYARLSVEPVRKALEAQAERMFGPGRPVTPAAPALRSSRSPVPFDERTEEWPG